MKALFIQQYTRHVPSVANNIRTLVVLVAVMFVLNGFVELYDNTKLKYFESKEYNYWIEYHEINYLGVIRDSRGFEKLSFESLITKKRSTSIAYNDILYCDTNSDNSFESYAEFESGRINIIEESGIEVAGWTYGTFGSFVAPLEGTRCFIKSEQTIYPDQLTKSNNPTRKNIFISNHFTI